MTKYEKVKVLEDGWSEEQFPIMRGYKMACCDCGLVHDMEFDVFEVSKFNKDKTFRGRKRWGKKWRIVMRVKRNVRATAAMRRKND